MALQEEFETQGNFLFKYRGELPLIFLVLGMVALMDTVLHLSNVLSIMSWNAYMIGCIGICFIGLGVRIFTIGYVPKNTSGRNTKGQVADEVNRVGIYSVVRHPLYVGNFLMWLGPAMLSLNIWFIFAFVFIYWVYYERIMFAEEQFLRKKFGDQYLDWAKVTPAFIPNFKNYRKPSMPFSWKKVIKQEKNGFVAIFLVTFLFSAIRSYLETGVFIKKDWLFYTMIGSGILYLIIKFLKSKTSLLDEKNR